MLGVLAEGNTLIMRGTKVILVDRLTGYLDCQRTHDQSTSEAILAIWKWSSRFGLPFKVISDGGGGFKNTFIKELKNIGITDKSKQF